MVCSQVSQPCSALLLVGVAWICVSKDAACACLTTVVHTPDSWPYALSCGARSSAAGILSSVGQQSEVFSAVLGFYEPV